MKSGQSGGCGSHCWLSPYSVYIITSVYHFPAKGQFTMRPYLNLFLKKKYIYIYIGTVAKILIKTTLELNKER